MKKYFESLKQSLHKNEEVLLSNKIAEMLRQFARADHKLLEIGCSNGNYAIDRAERLGINEVYGVDVGVKRLEQAKGKMLSVYECNIEKETLPFENDSFDILICNQVLEHLKEIHHVMNECHRVLRKDGLLLVSVPNLAALHNRLLLVVGKQPTTLQVMSEHVRGFAPGAFIWFLTFNGFFKIISYRGSGFYPIPPPLSTFLSKLFPRLAVYQMALLKKTKTDGISWVEEFKRRHIEGYGEDFWYE